MRSNVSGRLQKKYVKFLNGGADVNRRAFRSLAISNAVELFKLVFLNASTAPEVPTLLAETLRRYSEHDLYAAFNYLRDGKIMVKILTKGLATVFVCYFGLSEKC